MLNKLVFAAASGVLVSAGALVPAHASSGPDVTAEVCDSYATGAHCWNDGGKGYLQVVENTESSYSSINKGSWAGHTTYEWELEGTNSCLTYQKTPQANEFVLQTCSVDRDYQAFWYEDPYLVSEGASTPGVNWGVCAGDANGDPVYASSVFSGNQGCEWIMP